MIYYIRDNENNVIGFIYNEETYYYKKNIQQDVIGIYDNTFNQIVTYTYDSWGDIISIVDTSTNNIGTINPYRYRSYYYDNETELYYLNTRYYNPKWKRFINADGIIAANDCITNSNLYFYTNNNPVNGIDLDGKATWLMKQISNFFNKGIKKCKDSVTNTVKKGVSLYKKAKNKVISVGKKIVNGIKKAGVNIWNAVINSISLELSTGYGVNIPITSAGNNIGIHTDYTETAKKGKIEVSKTTSLELFFITVTGKSGDLCEINNEKCEYPPHYESGWFISFPNGVEISDSGIFIGQSFGIHIGMGGNLKAGAMFYWDDILK